MAGPGAGGGGAGLRRFRRLADLTALVTFLLIIVGGVVRVSDSGLGCGPGGSGTKGWPLCGGDVIPLVGDENTLIEFSHRVLAGVVVVLIALLCWRAYRNLRDRNAWAFRGGVAAGLLVLAQAGLGGLTVEHSLKEELVAAHLGAAMLLLGLLLWLSFKARSAAAVDAGEPVQPPVRGLMPYAATAAVLLLGAIVAGGYMAGTEEEGVNEAGPNIAGAHLACGALLLLGQLLLGALNVWLGEHATLIVAHLTVATLLWGAVVSLGYRVALLPSPTTPRERAPRAEASAAAA